MEPTFGVDHVACHFALAFAIHLFAFHLQLTFLYEATYHVQFHATQDWGLCHTKLYEPLLVVY